MVMMVEMVSVPPFKGHCLDNPFCFQLCWVHQAVMASQLNGDTAVLFWLGWDGGSVVQQRQWGSPVVECWDDLISKFWGGFVLCCQGLYLLKAICHICHAPGHIWSSRLLPCTCPVSIGHQQPHQWPSVHAPWPLTVGSPPRSCQQFGLQQPDEACSGETHCWPSNGPVAQAWR